MSDGIAKDMPVVLRCAASLCGNKVLFSSKSILTLLENTGRAGVWSYSFGSGELSWSDGFYRLLSLEIGSAIPSLEAIEPLIDPVHAAEFTADFPQILRGNRRYVRLPLVLSGGVRRWIVSQSEIIVDAVGSPKRVIGVALDVTEQQLALEELSARDAFRKKAARNLGAFILSPNGEISIQDKGEWLAFTGVQARRFDAEGWRCCVDTDDAARIAAALTSADARGKAGLIGFRWRDGEDRVSRGYLGLTSCTSMGGLVSAGMLLLLRDTEEPLNDYTVVTGNMIRAGRVLAGWSVAQLAEASSVSTPTIRRLEASRVTPSRTRSLMAILGAFRRKGIIITKSPDGRLSLNFGF